MYFVRLCWQRPPTHTCGPLDGSLYAQVKKRRSPGSPATSNEILPVDPPSVPLLPCLAHSEHLGEGNGAEAGQGDGTTIEGDREAQMQWEQEREMEP
ncbi:hypothetical protein AAFF_G00142710 [Aldrovandia affinis]|uniref:Uncharacterized protein n=1 Tax=Aldrovandia affinis TaxID=143900 RepID=A0AAD7WXM5_9TELE|nr:hypothetical protein AAFF_G00142710 [Aldrovandia affinis]